jgi:hypothetical protein
MKPNRNFYSFINYYEELKCNLWGKIDSKQKGNPSSHDYSMLRHYETQIKTLTYEE